MSETTCLVVVKMFTLASTFGMHKKSGVLC
jgi:hypothetical protein